MDNKEIKNHVEVNFGGTHNDSLSVWNIQGNRKAAILMQYIVNCHYREKEAGVETAMPMLLLKGCPGSGRRTMAIAFANSILGGNIEFREMVGHTTNYYHDNISTYLQNSNENTVLFIHCAELLPYHDQASLYMIRNNHMIFTPQHFAPMESYDQREPFENRLIILSYLKNSKKALIPSLHTAIDYHITLSDTYSIEEIISILRQKCEFNGLKYASEEIFRTIAHAATGNISEAISLLRLSYNIMRSNDREILNRNYAETALNLVAGMPAIQNLNVREEPIPF